MPQQIRSPHLHLESANGNRKPLKETVKVISHDPFWDILKNEKTLCSVYLTKVLWSQETTEYLKNNIICSSS